MGWEWVVTGEPLYLDLSVLLPSKVQILKIALSSVSRLELLALECQEVGRGLDQKF